jgi:hypothetical protein
LALPPGDYSFEELGDEQDAAGYEFLAHLEVRRARQLIGSGAGVDRASNCQRSLRAKLDEPTELPLLPPGLLESRGGPAIGFRPRFRLSATCRSRF